MGREPSRGLPELQGYVRFYTTVVAELEKLEAALAGGASSIEELLAPHRPLVAEIPGVLAAPFVREGQGSVLLALWRPVDAEGLAALGDVYEVVGRFSFQGVDDENLARLSGVVGALRRDTAALSAALDELERLPLALGERVATLVVEEASARAAHEETSRREIAPLLEALRARALQTKQAMKAVAIPDVTPEETAKEAYADYVARASHTWSTCRPFLEKCLSALASAAGESLGGDYPERLPFVAELPEELLVVAVPDADALADAERALQARREAMMALEERIRARKAAITALEQRIGLDKGAIAESDERIAQAQQLVEHAEARAAVSRADETVASYETQRATRVAGLQALREELGRAEVALYEVRKALSDLDASGAAKSAELEEQRGKEPLVFGKDAYKRRLLELEEELEAHARTVAEKTADKQRLKIDWSRAAVAKRTEEDQIALLEQWAKDAKEQRALAERREDEASRGLGTARPAHPPSVESARAGLAEAQSARGAVIRGAEARLGELRAQKEELLRLEHEERAMSAGLASLEAVHETIALTVREGKEAGRREMARQRQLAVVHHIEEVLGGLASSLDDTDELFGAPALAAISRRADQVVALSARLTEAAHALAAPSRELTERLRPQTAQMSAQLASIQAEFCDVVADVCARAFAR